MSASDVAVGMYSGEGIPASLLAAASKSVLLHIRKLVEGVREVHAHALLSRPAFDS